MSEFTIYTALNVPTVLSHPSVKCLQWTGDGQACFLTKTAVYILTPDTGINFDTSSVIRASAGSNNATDKCLGWFRTMIECGKGGPPSRSWAEGSQEWGALSLGSLDMTLRGLACSPSNLTNDSGCVLAVLNSNMELSLWSATKNFLKGEWIKVHDITSLFMDESSIASTLSAQIISVTWTTQPDFGVTPAPSLDGSFLITGSRAGSLSFLRFDADNSATSPMCHVHTMKVYDKWITQLAVSAWTLVEIGKCEAFLAYGSSDGSIGLVKIVHTLQPLEPESTFGDEHVAETVFEVQQPTPVESDNRGITALAWAEPPGRSPILVHCKPGVVRLWSSPSTGPGWSGSRTLALQTQKFSVGSSSMCPVSGISYLRREDVLLVILSDGSFHVIGKLSMEPSLGPWSPDAALTSANLSGISRSVFVQAEQGNIQPTDVNHIRGLSCYDDLGTIIWVHEACRPSDFSYKHDAKHNSMLIVAQMWQDPSNDTILDELSYRLDNAKASCGDAPIHILRPIFTQLRNKERLFHLHPSILDILRRKVSEIPAVANFRPGSNGLTSLLKLAFRRSLRRHLFGWDTTLSLRMRLAVADFCWKLSADPHRQAECGEVAQYLLNSISYRVLRAIFHHLTAIGTLFEPNDVPFAMRMVVQASLPGCPPELCADAQKLSVTVQAKVPAAEMQRLGGLDELCPACQTVVPLLNITNAVCPNGHTWSRCTVTSFILSTPMVRTCVGCSRKAFLPLSLKSSTTQNWLPLAAQSWIVEELLEAVNRCLFCGNRFVSIL